MATYKTISARDIRTTKSYLNQLVDLVQEDISGSATRKKYETFLTGTVSSAGVSTGGVTSSIYHTVFDQDYKLQTSNALFDVTMGLFSGSATVVTCSTGQDVNGKLLFPSESLMMREKINTYRTFAQLLLGDAAAKFTSPFSNPSADGSDNIDEALFICFKRLFTRDSIKRETFAMRLFQSASDSTGVQNLWTTPGISNGTPLTITDVGASSNVERSQQGGDVGNLVKASNTSKTAGLIFYQQGIAVLDMQKVFSASQHMSGVISAVGNTTNKINVGNAGTGNPTAKLIPDLACSASIDDFLEHICSTRFDSGSFTTITFQNNTQINSTLVFCRAEADEFNFSTNPTYTDAEGRIVVIDESSQGIQKAFSFITSVGLYDANEELIAVAKLSRPVEKNDEIDLTFRVRLDF